MLNIFITRQPIYDVAHTVFGYELLYCDPADTENKSNDSRISAAKTILGTFFEVGSDTMVGSSMAFVDIPEAFLLNRELIPMFEGQSVLELSGDTIPSAEVIQGAARLRKAGYFLALDDYSFKEDQQKILEHVDYVKIDVKCYSLDVLMNNMAGLKGKNCKTIAINVDTHEMSEVCAKIGFDYFQGDFFCKPKIVEGSVLDSNKAVLLRLVKVLLDTSRSYDEIADVLSHDVPMTYKLLKYINSASFPNRTEVESVKEALMLVGADTVRNWANMILFSEMSSGKPSSIIITALVRARMCETLAQNMDKGLASQMFITGLFSMLDVMLDKPMVEVLDELPLISPVRLALLDYEGKHGMILKQVIMYERGLWNELMEEQSDTDLFIKLYPEAISWAYSTCASLTR